MDAFRQGIRSPSNPLLEVARQVDCKPLPKGYNESLPYADGRICQGYYAPLC
jgi:hypothetical protein